MSIFLHTTLEVSRGRVTEFLTIMRRVVEIQEQAGWRLVGAFEFKTGKFNTFIDLWELDDYNHYQSGLDYCFSQPDIEEITDVLAQSVLTETVVFMDKVSYGK